MGVLCVVGNAGKVETSTDHGATWTARTSGTAKNLVSVASKPDATLTVAVGDQGAVISSADQGATWTLQTGPASYTSDYMTGIAWNGTRWVATGYNFGGPGSYTQALIWYSTDAVTWTRVYLWTPGFGTNAQAAGVVVLGTTFYAFGALQYGVMSSTSGTTWTNNTNYATSWPLASFSPATAAVASGRLMLATATAGPGVQFITTTDGSTWSSAGSVGAFVARGVAGYGSGWASVGYYSDARATYTSTNDFTGAPIVAPGITAGQLSAVCWSGQKYAGAGSDGAVYTSTTGASWTGNATNTANSKLGICNIPNSAPTAALLSSPANNAAIDLTANQTFAWSFQDPDLPLDSQKYYALKFQRTAPTVGVAKWWDGAAMQTTETYVLSSVESATVTANLIGTNGETYAWSVKTKDQLDTAATAYSSTRSFTGSVAPVVAVNGPSGTVTTTTTPTISWTYTDSESTAQESYWAKVFSAAQYGAGGFDPATSTAVWDSGQTFSTAVSAAVTTALADGVTYRAYVQVTQVGGQASAWAYSGFDVDITTPPTPTLVAAVDSAAARIVLTVAGDYTPYSSGQYRVQCHDGDGNWRDILNGIVTVPVALTATVYDYSAPPNALRYYRAATTSALTSTSQVQSDWSATATATLTITTAWLKHKTDPTLNQSVRVRKGYGWTQGSGAQVYDPVGLGYAVVLDDVAKGVQTTLGLETITDDERVALQALVDAKVALLFQDPLGEQHWVWIAGNVGRELQVGTTAWWVWSIPVVEVAEPTS